MEHVFVVDFMCTLKKKAGVEYMWAHSKNGLIQPDQVNGVTLFWFTLYIVGFFFKD